MDIYFAWKAKKHRIVAQVGCVALHDPGSKYRE